MLVLLFVLGACAPVETIETFNECVRHGHRITREEAPRICRGPGDREFTEGLGNIGEMAGEIRVDNPLANEVLVSPVTISGEARGYRFAEGAFVVRLEDDEGFELAKTMARADTDWMTEDFVLFHTSLYFRSNGTADGVLIFEKANPLGIGNSAALAFPVRFR